MIKVLMLQPIRHYVSFVKYVIIIFQTKNIEIIHQKEVLYKKQ